MPVIVETISQLDPSTTLTAKQEASPSQALVQSARLTSEEVK